MTDLEKDEEFLFDTLVNCEVENYEKAFLILEKMSKEELISFIKDDITDGIACYKEENELFDKEWDVMYERLDLFDKAYKGSVALHEQLIKIQSKGNK